MQMSSEEIVRSYREAKDKAKQLEILSELNACDKQKIKDILAAGGIDHRQLPRSRKEKAAAPAKADRTAKERIAEERTSGERPSKADHTEENQAAVQEKPVNTQCGGDRQEKKKSRRIRRSISRRS